jgi:hypothetical protein
MTKDEIRAEHEAAIASLTLEQRRAFRRINRSFLESRFNNCSARDMLEHVFAEEAEARSRDGFDQCEIEGHDVFSA